MPATRQGTVAVDGTTLHYDVTGSGPPIILLHGFSFDRRMWDDQVIPLAAHRTVVRYDLRGFGASPAGTTSYSHADDLSALIEHLGYRQAALMGLSLGGGAAINFAVQQPDAVTQLIAVDPSLGGFRWSVGFVAAQRAVRATAMARGIDAAIAEWLALPIFAPAMGRPDVAHRLTSLASDYSGSHWTTADLGRPLKPPAIDRLGTITARTLVLVGELDTPDFHAIADAIATGVHGARRVLLPGVGHMANIEDPAGFNRAVLDFLSF
jgi:3-oxoadipate enol-lactonase